MSNQDYFSQQQQTDNILDTECEFIKNEHQQSIQESPLKFKQIGMGLQPSIELNKDVIALSSVQASTQKLHDKIAANILTNKKLDGMLKSQLQTWMKLVNQEKQLLQKEIERLMSDMTRVRPLDLCLDDEGRQTQILADGSSTHITASTDYKNTEQKGLDFKLKQFKDIQSDLFVSEQTPTKRNNMYKLSLISQISEKITLKNALPQSAKNSLSKIKSAYRARSSSRRERKVVITEKQVADETIDQSPTSPTKKHKTLYQTITQRMNLNASQISGGIMGMAPSGFMTSRELKPDLNQSIPESHFKRRTTLGGTTKKDREKSKSKFIPGVTTVMEYSDDEDEDQQKQDDTFQEPVVAQNTMRQNYSTFITPKKQRSEEEYDDFNQTFTEAGCRTARQINFTKPKSAKKIKSDIEQIKYVKEINLKAEKAELKVLRYKRLFHQVNQKLQNQSKLYAEQLEKMSKNIDSEELDHAQTKITLAKMDSQCSDLNEMLELLQMKNEKLQQKLMAQTEIRGFMNKQWDMLNDQHQNKQKNMRKSKSFVLEDLDTILEEDVKDDDQSSQVNIQEDD